ncbi:MAG TPA: efflux RND transporter periplasmic adaptor subunit [Acidobacteriaceae bacterium]|nr:efflux RND transporter periplasmic adaptor subunit [Acidobacteriaceae bacterium]
MKTRTKMGNRNQRLFAQKIWVLCAAATFASGCKKAEQAPTPEVYVQASHPTIAAIGEEIDADAILSPLSQAAISTKVTAPVRKFYVQRGSAVHAGQLLATLENKDLAAAAMDNQGSYTAAQAAFETTTKATAPEDLTKARLDLAQAKATLDLNQSIVDARTHLFTQGAIPGRDLDTAKATLVQSQAAYDVANQHLQAIERVGNRAAMSGARGSLQSAKGKLLGAEAELSYTEIRSPISGVVTDRPLFAGETTAAGTPLITVMDTSVLIGKLHIAQSQAQQLAVGSSAIITVPGLPDSIPARVSLISPALDPGSTTVEVWLRVDNARGILKAGTPVHARIDARRIDNALTVPLSAVEADADGSKFVMVMAPDSTAHKKPIAIGIQTADRAQVLSGITQADTIISSGAYGVDENTRVKIGADPDVKSKDNDTSAPEAGGKDAQAK